VVVADDETDTAEASAAKRAEELAPEHLGFGVTDRAAQHFAFACQRDAGRDDHGAGHDLTADAALQIGRVREHVGELDMAQRAASKRRHLLVETGADPAQLVLLMPLVAPSAATRSSTLRVDTPWT
jgi:hypothetical protein